MFIYEFLKDQLNLVIDIGKQSQGKGKKKYTYCNINSFKKYRVKLQVHIMPLIFGHVGGLTYKPYIDLVQKKSYC